MKLNQLFFISILRKLYSSDIKAFMLINSLKYQVYDGIDLILSTPYNWEYNLFLSIGARTFIKLTQISKFLKKGFNYIE